MQSNKYNQPQLVEAVEFDTAERESLSPTIVVRKMIIVLQMKFSRIYRNVYTNRILVE